MGTSDTLGISSYQSKFDKLRGQKELLSNQIKSYDSKITYLTNRLNSAERLSIIIQEIAKQTMSKLEFRVSSIVTAALHAVYPNPPDFEVEFEKVRNQLECYLWFNQNGNRLRPIDSDAGGALDVASFALRLTYWSLRKNRPTFILDEPFKYVSVDLQEKCAEMIKMLSDKMGVQVIMISHLPNINITADKEYRVTKEGMVSVVREVK